MDAIDRVLDEWARERPDLDVSGIATIGRLSRLAAVVQERLDEVFAEFGLQSWEFDVLATLRRSGVPYELTPGQLDSALLITSGTTTHRVSKLEQRGYVTRTRDADDRRVVRVRLTDEGFRVQAAAHAAHAENELQILAKLGVSEREALTRGLQALSATLDGIPAQPPTRA